VSVDDGGYVLTRLRGVSGASTTRKDSSRSTELCSLAIVFIFRALYFSFAKCTFDGKYNVSALENLSMQMTNTFLMFLQPDLQ